MKLVGIKWYAIWFTLWLRSLVVFIPLSLVIASFSTIVLQPNSSNNFLFAEKALLKNTNFFLFLIFLLTYSLQVSTFILFISQFFSKSNYYCIFFKLTRSGSGYDLVTVFLQTFVFFRLNFNYKIFTEFT